MNSDQKLQKAVFDQLDFDPAIDVSHIGVTARDAIVTLSGHVGSNAEKRAAEILAGKVAGVRAVIDDLLVEMPGKVQTWDETVAQRCCDVLAADPSVPFDRVHISVKDGNVTIHGDVDREQDRVNIARLLEHVTDVKAVTDDLKVLPPVRSEAVARRIRQMLEPISEINANHIEVQIRGTHVTLSGRVNSWHERGVAESAVWSVPGVTGLDDQIEVL